MVEQRYYNKMPCWMLVFTSIGFIVPAIFAARLKKRNDKILIQALTGTSVLYHGTVHPIAKLIDMCVAHFVGIRYMLHGIKYFVFHNTLHDTIAITIGGISTYLYYQKSLRIENPEESRKWHACVHLTAQLALTMFLHSPKKYVIPNEQI